MRVDKNGYSIANSTRRLYKLLLPNPWGKELIGYVGFGQLHNNRTFVFHPRDKKEWEVRSELELTFVPVPGLPGIQRCEQLEKPKRGEI